MKKCKSWALPKKKVMSKVENKKTKIEPKLEDININQTRMNFWIYWKDDLDNKLCTDKYLKIPKWLNTQRFWFFPINHNLSLNIVKEGLFDYLSRLVLNGKEKVFLKISWDIHENINFKWLLEVYDNAKKRTIRFQSI